MTVCLAIFFLCYVVLLLCLFPLLVQEPPKVVPTHRGEVLRPVVEKMKEGAAHFRPGAQMAGAAISVAAGGSVVQQLAENVAVSIQKQIQQFRKSEGVTDASLLRQAVGDIENVRKHRRQHELQKQPEQPIADKQPKSRSVRIAKEDKNKKPVSGVIVLGMHRSGTSMLSGLLATGMGYKTGGPLIGEAFDNKKGFFELVPAV